MFNNVKFLKYVFFVNFNNHENSLNNLKLIVFFLFDKIIIKLFLKLRMFKTLKKHSKSFDFNV